LFAHVLLGRYVSLPRLQSFHHTYTTPQTSIMAGNTDGNDARNLVLDRALLKDAEKLSARLNEGSERAEKLLAKSEARPPTTFDTAKLRERLEQMSRPKRSLADAVPRGLGDDRVPVSTESNPFRVLQCSVCFLSTPTNFPSQETPMQERTSTPTDRPSTHLATRQSGRTEQFEKDETPCPTSTGTLAQNRVTALREGSRQAAVVTPHASEETRGLTPIQISSSAKSLGEVEKNLQEFFQKSMDDMEQRWEQKLAEERRKTEEQNKQILALLQDERRGRSRTGRFFRSSPSTPAILGGNNQASSQTQGHSTSGAHEFQGSQTEQSPISETRGRCRSLSGVDDGETGRDLGSSQSSASECRQLTMAFRIRNGNEWKTEE